MTTAVAREVQMWRLLAQDLRIEFESPYFVESDGKRYEYVGRVPQLGPPGGTLIMLSYASQAAEAASSKGFGFSCVELGEHVQRATAIEMLKDWGWNGTGGSPPGWWREV